MYVVTIKLFNHWWVEECEDLAQAVKVSQEWHAKVKGPYPHRDFEIRFYEVIGGPRTQGKVV